MAATGKALSDVPAINRFLTYCRVRTVPGKTVMIHAGDLPDSLYYIIDGSVEVMIEDEFKGLRLAIAQGLEREPLGFGFETAAAERAGDLAIRIEQRFSAELLRARTFHARDDAERDGFVHTGGFREGLEEIFHHAT